MSEFDRNLTSEDTESKYMASLNTWLLVSTVSPLMYSFEFHQSVDQTGRRAEDRRRGARMNAASLRFLFLTINRSNHIVASTATYGRMTIEMYSELPNIGTNEN